MRLPASAAVAEAARRGLMLWEGEKVSVGAGERVGGAGVEVGGGEARAVPVAAAGVREGAGAMVAEGVQETLAQAEPLDSTLKEGMAVALGSGVGVPRPPPPPTPPPALAVESRVGMTLPVAAAVPLGERVGQWGETLGEEDGVAPPSPPPPLGSAVAVLLPPTPALPVGDTVGSSVGKEEGVAAEGEGVEALNAAVPVGAAGVGVPHSTLPVEVTVGLSVGTGEALSSRPGEAVTVVEKEAGAPLREARGVGVRVKRPEEAEGEEEGLGRGLSEGAAVGEAPGPPLGDPAGLAEREVVVVGEGVAAAAVALPRVALGDKCWGVAVRWGEGEGAREAVGGEEGVGSSGVRVGGIPVGVTRAVGNEVGVLVGAPTLPVGAALAVPAPGVAVAAQAGEGVAARAKEGVGSAGVALDSSVPVPLAPASRDAEGGVEGEEVGVPPMRLGEAAEVSAGEAVTAPLGEGEVEVEGEAEGLLVGKEEGEREGVREGLRDSDGEMEGVRDWEVEGVGRRVPVEQAVRVELGVGG